MGRVVTRLWHGVEGGGLTGHGEMQVDTVQQRAGEFVAVTGDLIGAATATAAGVAEISTGAGVHGGHQLEAGRETDLVAGTGDDNFA